MSATVSQDSPVSEPVARAAMLIRRPVSTVFEAFADPEITRHFWFTRGSGRLSAGSEVEWEWSMYSISVKVQVLALVENQRIEIEWPGAQGPSRVEWIFRRYAPDGLDGVEQGTFVEIANRGFGGTSAEQIAEAIASTEGFTLVLAGLKAYLEHGVELNLVADRFPPGLEEEEPTMEA